MGSRYAHAATMVCSELPKGGGLLWPYTVGDLPGSDVGATLAGRCIVHVHGYACERGRGTRRLETKKARHDGPELSASCTAPIEREPPA